MAKTTKKRRKPYSLVEGGPVQRAVELRVEGVPYARIVETLRAERPDECAGLDEQTVARWMNASRLNVDTLIGIVERKRAERLPRGATEASQDRLAEVRDLIGVCTKMITGKLEEGDSERLKGVRPDTFLLKLYEEERKLSFGGLAAVPQAKLRELVLVVIGELASELLRRNMVSADRLKSAAADIEREITKRMPQLIRERAARDAATEAA